MKKSMRNKKRDGGRRKSIHRKTRKAIQSKGKWVDQVMKVYKEMKMKNSDATYGEAMKEASRRKKNGQL